MNEKRLLKGRGVASGVAEGEAMVTGESFGLAFGLDPATGQVKDPQHSWLGQNVRGKVLVYPYGKGSTTAGIFILEMVRCGNSPAAIINLETEPLIGAGFIMAKLFYHQEIPVVDRLEPDPFQVIADGDIVRVDGNNGGVEVFKRKPGG